MVKRFAVMVAASLPLVMTVAAQPQQEAPVYTYVAEWTIERAHWGSFSSFLEKNTKPVLDRLVSDGAIAEWGRTENTIHTEDRATHTIWWCAPTFSGTQRVLAELDKVSGSTGAQPGMTRHRDYLFRSVVFRTRHSGATTGFLMTTYDLVKPGKGPEWRELWEKNTRPTLESLLEARTILGYGLDVEQVHTGAPGGRYGWIVAPNAESVDKVMAALSARMQKMTPEARRELGNAFREASVPEAHRDGLERIVNYVRK